MPLKHKKKPFLLCCPERLWSLILEDVQTQMDIALSKLL